MKELVIVGAGGFGRELLQWCKDINRISAIWQIKGFIDDNINALSAYDCDYKIVGSIQKWKPQCNEVFALGIAEPHVKERVVQLLKSKGATFTDVIHPHAEISEFVIRGEGLVMYPGASLNVNTKVGDYVTILASGIGHDAIVDDYATISSYCGITRGVHIGKRAFLADHSTILPEHSVGDDAYVGAGSVVVRNIPNGKRVFGNPAKQIDF